MNTQSGALDFRCILVSALIVLMRAPHLYSAPQNDAARPCAPCAPHGPPSVPTSKATDLVPDLLARVSSNDPAVRAALISELVVVKDGSCMVETSLKYDLPARDYEFIVETALDGLDPNRLDRLTALRSLHSLLTIATQHRLPNTACLLVPWLQHRDGGVRSGALQYLRLAGDTSTAQYVADLLDDEDRGVRRAAVDLLVQMRSSLCIPALKNQLQSDKYLRRYDALQKLVAVRALEAIPEIEDVLNDSNSNNQFWALWALVQLDARHLAPKITDLVATGMYGDSFVDYAVSALAAWGDPWGVSNAMDRFVKKQRRLFMSMRLVELNATQVVAPLIKFLESEEMVGGDVGTDANTRADAMELLAKLGGENGIAVFRHIASSGGEFLANAAASQLGELRAIESLPELRVLLDRCRYCRPALMAAAKIGTPDAVRMILHHPKLGYGALWHLARAGDPDLHNRLVETALVNMPRASIPQRVNDLSQRLGIPIRFHGEFEDWHTEHTCSEFGESNALYVVRLLVDAINYKKRSRVMYLDNSEIHIVEWADAIRFWDEWLKNH